MFTGTLGVIIRANLNGIIPSIKPLLDKIKQTDFRLSHELELKSLKEANELLPTSNNDLSNGISEA